MGEKLELTTTSSMGSTVQAELVLGTYRLANEGPFGTSIEAQTIY